MSKVGSINKISIKNFVTYADVVFYPGSNLNIVIGPNGTGKSTVVAAIILGLGGSPKTIGRGTKVAEYIRHDCTEAKIDIELHDGKPGKTKTISRAFNVSNQSTWHINGKHCSEQDVKKLVQKLNIQVNNLCQFLPQDRVQDFAKMNKKELLLNTQLALGRQDLVDKHEALIKIQEQQKALGKEIESITNKLEQAEKSNSRLEGKVQNLNEKRKFVEEIDHIKRKLAWKNYDKYLNTKLQIKDDLSKAHELMTKHKKNIQPLETKLLTLNKQSANLQNKLIHSNLIVKQADNKVSSHMEHVENIEKMQREILCDMKVKMTALQQRQNEVNTMKAKVDKLVNDEQAFVDINGNDAAIDEKMADLVNECSKYSKKIEEVNRKLVIISSRLRKTTEQVENLDKSLIEMENIKLKRLDILRRRDHDAHAAILWLRENKNMFRGQVYEPIMMELNVLNPVHTKYLENIIPMRDRVAFTCENREDMNLFLRNVRDKMKLNINVLHSGPEHPPLSSFRAPIPIEQLRKYGLYAYTNSLVTGPEAIMKYLCRMYSLHSIPIGDESTYNKASQIPAEIKLFFSENHRFYVSTSRYSGEKSTRISGVEPDGTFGICMDYNRINVIKRELDDLKKEKVQLQCQCDAVEAENATYTNRRQEIYVQRKSLAQCIEQVKKIRERLEAARTSMRNFLEDQPTEKEIKSATSLKMKKLMVSGLKKHQLLLTAISDFDGCVQNEELIQIELEVVRNKVTCLDNETIDLRNAYKSSKKDYDKIEVVYIRAEKDADEALNSAKNLSLGFTPDDSGFDKFRSRYNSLTNNSNKLQNIIEEIQTKVECMLTADTGELKLYENGKKVIEACQEELSSKDALIISINTKRTALYEEWLTPLRELTLNINQNFANYFESMGCAGEVQISCDNGELDFSDYGLAIRVTYRSEDPLQELNRFVQSGGERAVATAVFMLSMQDLTAAPFRCVDEINQGMDPQNERRIFEILVKATSKKDTCQYFLITPKLIPSLKFGTAMQVNIVHNGQYCDAGRECRLRTILDNHSMVAC